MLLRASVMAAMLLVRPCAIPAQAPAIDREYRSYIAQDFERFHPQYNRLHRQRVKQLEALEPQVFDRERKGEQFVCAHEILLETRWLLGSTTDFERIDSRLRDLRNALGESPASRPREMQNAVDGSCGACYTEWFFKLDATYDYQKQHRLTDAPRFLDRVNSPEKLRSYFDSIAISNVAEDGVDHRRELNEALADLLRLILHSQPIGYRWAPGMKAAMLDIVLEKLRNPQTGWWGERYIHNGATYFVDDLSVTFHAVTYLSGQVPNLDRVIATALAMKNLNYPQGWLDNDHYTNHNNMDAVVLFRYGWPFASAKQRLEISQEINRMLAWCLTESLQSDGSFRASGDDDSIEEAEYFGVAFLARAGYFDARRRFWTRRDFPESESVGRRLRNFIAGHCATGAAGGTYYASPLEQLDSSNPSRP